jgi:hypothetical protein
MPVSRGTRFADLPVLEVGGPDGEPRQVLGLRLAHGGPTGPGVHQVVQGEGPDLIALRHLGDAQLWWRILDVNPLVYPLDLAPGDVLALPAAGPVTRANRARSF